MMLPDFLWMAIISGLSIATVAGVLGCFVVWRKMAYFGDSLAHSSLLGVALGLVTGLNISFMIVLVCSAFALLLTLLQRHRYLAADTLLGIFAHSSLSFGIIAINLLNSPQIDLESFLFGEILSVNYLDLGMIIGGSIIVLVILCKYWSSLALITINEDLAIAEGINAPRLNLLFMLLTTLVVAISIRVVGALLITSLLILPAATGRLFARSPEQMASFAIIFGWLAVGTGLAATWHFDTPSGPSIVAAAAIMFTLLLPFAQRFR